MHELVTRDFVGLEREVERFGEPDLARLPQLRGGAEVLDAAPEGAELRAVLDLLPDDVGERVIFDLGLTHALGYYTGADLPLYGTFVRQTTVFDHWFCSLLGPTYPNRYYTHSARTQQLDNSTVQNMMPTIWDRLAAAGVPANYYFNDLPFLALWGEKYLPISRPFESASVLTAAESRPSRKSCCRRRTATPAATAPPAWSSSCSSEAPTCRSTRAMATRARITL